MYIFKKLDNIIELLGRYFHLKQRMILFSFSRESLSDNWKVNVGSSSLKQLEMSGRYRLWLDEVSQIFGGLDMCAMEIVQSNTGKEYIIEVNDSTMELSEETREDDCQHIAELIIHKMQIYCRSDRELTILT